MSGLLAKETSNKVVYVLLFIISLSLPLQLDYFFDGASRFIPLRVVLIIVPLYLLYVSLFAGGVGLRALVIFYFGFLIPLIYLLSWHEFFDFELMSKTFLNYFYVFSLVAVFYDGLPRVSYNQRRKILLCTMLLMFLILLIECVARFYYPALDLNDEQLQETVSLWGADVDLNREFFEYQFYAFKYSSIMFYDSNYVGLFSVFLCVLAIYFYHEYSPGVLVRLAFVLPFVFVLLSFSRASVITLIFILYLEIVWVFFSKRRFVALAGIGSFSLFAVISLAGNLQGLIEDGSFYTKIGIWTSLLDVVDVVDLHYLLFGFGMIDGGYIYSYEENKYAHALIPLLLGEVGILGVFLYLAVVGFLAGGSGRFGAYFIITIVLNGFSLVDPWQILIFWGLLMMSKKLCCRKVLDDKRCYSAI